EIRLQCGEHIARGHAEHLGLVPIHARIQAWAATVEIDVRVGDSTIFRRSLSEVACGGLERLVAVATAILDHHAEAASRAEPDDGRRLADANIRTGDEREPLAQIRSDLRPGLAELQPLFERVEDGPHLRGARLVVEAI